MKSKNLPRAKSRGKKLNILVAVLILFIGIAFGGFLVLKSKIGRANMAEQITNFFGSANQTTIPIINEKNKDSDNDGLTDWQEEIYKTNPINPDTDGDGYLYG